MVGDAAKGAGMILARYFLRRLLGAAAMVSGVFLGMILLLDMVEQLRRLSDLGRGFGSRFAPVLLLNYGLKRSTKLRAG